LDNSDIAATKENAYLNIARPNHRGRCSSRTTANFILPTSPLTKPWSRKWKDSRLEQNDFRLLPLAKGCISLRWCDLAASISVTGESL